VRTSFLKDGNWRIEGGVFIHSSPSNSVLYDTMCKPRVDDSYDESNIDDTYWSERVSRRLKLISLINPSRIHHSSKTDEEMQKIKHGKIINNGRVLDCCSGGGNWSIAALELGAREVVSCDGSLVLLANMLRKIKNSNSLPKGRQVLGVQGDANYLSDIFVDEYFDFSFIRMALHHLKNPFKTIYDLARVTRPLGNISFDCFLESCTPDITRDLREYFLKKDLSHVYNFLSLFGKKNCKNIENLSDIIDIKDVISGDKNIPREYDEDIDFLISISDKYGIDMTDSKMQLENFQTDYIHNLKDEDILSFCVDDLGLKLMDRARFRGTEESPPDRGMYTFQVTHNWSKFHTTFPIPSDGPEFK